jgi:hypothetical protein
MPIKKNMLYTIVVLYYIFAPVHLIAASKMQTPHRQYKAGPSFTCKAHNPHLSPQTSSKQQAKIVDPASKTLSFTFTMAIAELKELKACDTYIKSDPKRKIAMIERFFEHYMPRLQNREPIMLHNKLINIFKAWGVSAKPLPL